jgi:hypothetical protein
VLQDASPLLQLLFQFFVPACYQRETLTQDSNHEGREDEDLDADVKDKKQVMSNSRLSLSIMSREIAAPAVDI